MHKIICLLACIVLCLSGCRSYDTAANTGYEATSSFTMDSATEESTVKESEQNAQVETGDEPVYQQKDVKLIRNAYLEYETQNLNTSLSELEEVLEEYAGYVETSQIYTGTDSFRYASYTVRVPSSKYDIFLDAMTDTGDVGQLTRKTENTENVGDQYYDSESRLHTAKIKLERLQELLKKADKMSDILTIENSIAEVEAEIDSYSSTLKRYDGLIDYATFQIEMKEVVRYSPTEETGLWHKTKEAFTESIEKLSENVQSVILFTVRHWFSISLIIVCALLICRILINNQKKSVTDDENNNLVE